MTSDSRDTRRLMTSGIIGQQFTDGVGISHSCATVDLFYSATPGGRTQAFHDFEIPRADAVPDMALTTTRLSDQAHFETRSGAE